MALNLEVIEAKEAPVPVKAGSAAENEAQREVNGVVAAMLEKGTGFVGRLPMADAKSGRSLKTKLNWGVKRYNESSGARKKAFTWDDGKFVYFRIDEMAEGEQETEISEPTVEDAKQPTDSAELSTAGNKRTA